MTARAWLGVREFAALAGIGERHARRALRRCLDDEPWRGAFLVVRYTPGTARGGVAGRALQVRESSLPADLRGQGKNESRDSHLTALDAAAIEAAAVDPVPARLSDWRLRIIGPVLAHPPGSAARKAAVNATAATVRDLPGGRRGRVSRAQIYEWLARFEAGGVAGLEGAGDGNPRPAIVGRRWDAAVPFDDATKRRIADEVLTDVRSLWAASADHGWRWVSRFASRTLAALTADAGFDPGRAELQKICRLTRHFCERGREYRALAVHDRDAKRFADEQPRIARTAAGLAPMEIVEGDVHHLDVLLRRADGSTFTPKAVCWLDRANRRMFATLVFLPKGKGVRQEHAIESFLAMVADELWGMPQSLYLDNGGEYNWADFIDDAMKLDAVTRPGAGGAAERRSMIVKAQPYNAPAKSIEPAFAVIERAVLSPLPGWIGGDRMRSPTKNVGRGPEVWPGTEDEFRAAFQVALSAYETMPQEGGLGGLSPRQAFAAAVDRGWERTAIDAEALRSVFADELPRKVSRGAVSYRGVSYTSRELQALPAGSSVAIRVPRVGPADRLAVMRDGAYLCTVAEDRPFSPLDPAGAEESARRKRAHREAIKAMRADVNALDMVERQAELVDAEPPAPVPKVGATIELGETAERIGRELAMEPAERAAIERSETDDMIARRKAARLARATG